MAKTSNQTSPQPHITPQPELLCGRCRKPKPCKCGRPTKYKPEYCQLIVEFFEKESHLVAINKTYYKAAEDEELGSVKSEKYEVIANKFPTFQRFAHTIGVYVDTFNDWCKQYPEFSSAYSKAKQIQESILIENGLQGIYNPAFSMFIAKNNFGYSDKQDINIGGQPDNPIQTQLSPQQLELIAQQVLSKQSTPGLNQ